MEFINLESLNERLPQISRDYQSQQPFNFIVFDDFFYADKAEEIHQNYPTITDGMWDGTTYIDQKNKFRKTDFESGTILDRLFKELNSPEFLKLLEQITGIDDIIGDEELFGGGLHQSTRGAFLNVHVDYNIHPTTKYHRRLNVLVYMNKEWKNEYEGHLELWDLSPQNNRLLDKIPPLFNKCVIFETNEISFHGHPKPLRTPDGVNRKSIATYYYTKTRPDGEVAPEHNTVYVNTGGVAGQIKRFSSGVKALLERINKK